MLRSLKVVLRYGIRATDGEVGTVSDIYFDDHSWVVRYLVIDTGEWLPGRRVLISPNVVGKPEWNGEAIPVSLSKEQVKNSPSILTDLPVSRQKEVEMASYYGWPLYWELVPNGEGDPHLRSVKEVLGYNIRSQNSKIGHVEDFIADVEQWAIRYIAVDTRTWVPGKKVLIAPDWIDAVDWGNKHVKVGLTSEAIKNSPEYDPAVLVNREYEVRLYDYYGRPKYWYEA